MTDSTKGNQRRNVRCLRCKKAIKHGEERISKYHHQKCYNEWQKELNAL